MVNRCKDRFYYCSMKAEDFDPDTCNKEPKGCPERQTLVEQLNKGVESKVAKGKKAKVGA